MEVLYVLGALWCVGRLLFVLREIAQSLKLVAMTNLALLERDATPAFKATLRAVEAGQSPFTEPPLQERA